MTEKREALSGALKEKATAAQLPAEQKKADPNNLPPAKKVAHYLAQHGKSIASVLPSNIKPERMQRIALNVIRTNPALLECSIDSLMGGVMEAAKLGLEPGLMGQCYLIPFNNKKTGNKEAQFIIGYKGLIDLVRRSGQVSTIEARTVYEHDEFDFEYGLESKLKHKPNMQNRGEAIAYYGVCKLKDGGSSFIVMSTAEMHAYRDKHAKSKNFGPWVDDFDAMARKTCLRQLIKYLPISVEHLAARDEQSGEEMHQEIKNAEIIDLGELEPAE